MTNYTHDSNDETFDVREAAGLGELEHNLRYDVSFPLFPREMADVQCN